VKIPKHIDGLVEERQPLPSDEQLKLVKEAQGGSKEARDNLVLSNLRFVLQEIRGLPTIPKRLEFNDLFDAGVQGMLEALERFDLDSEVNFLTYAYWWIKKRILQTVYGNLSIIRIPKAQVKQLERLHALSERRAQRLLSGKGCTKRIPMTALEMGHELFAEENMPTFLRLKCALEAYNITDSYSDNVGRLELSEEDTQQDEAEFMDELERTIGILSDREEDIVKRYYGLGCPPQNYDEIGELYILTPERIRQILQGALGKIRESVLPVQNEEDK